MEEESDDDDDEDNLYSWFSFYLKNTYKFALCLFYN